MFWWSRDRTLAWLSRHRVTPAEGGLWLQPGSAEPLTDNDLAHELTEAALEDPSLSSDERLCLGFGLLDLLDDYGVALYLAWEFTGVQAAHRDEINLVWDFCREILERESDSMAVPYWLWVEWFEDVKTSSIAFRQLTEGWHHTTADPSADRRIDRVLRVSGPVPWDAKAPVYQEAVMRPELHDALMRGISGSFRDVYGKVDAVAAVEMLERLTLSGELKSEARALVRAIRGHG